MSGIAASTSDRIPPKTLMSSLAAKYKSTVDEAIAHLLSRCEHQRGLTSDDLRARITAAVEKYLGAEGLQNAEIKSFIDEIRADDLCLIIACERGDEKAWEDLVRDFDGTVKSAARKMTSGSED